MSKWHDSKIRKNLQPYTNKLKNWAAYHLYCLRYNRSLIFRYFKNIVYAGSVIYTLHDLASIRETVREHGPCGLLSPKMIPLAIAVILLISDIIALIRSTAAEEQSKKFVSLWPIENYYNGVKAPENWEKIVVLSENSGNRSKGTIFRSSEVDAWLRNNAVQQSVSIQRNKGGERGLRKKIRTAFKDTLYHFLRFNYRYSQFYGKQFSNEKKWGLLSDLPVKEEGPVQVQKTRYYDSILTNISPGKQLIRTRNNEVLVSLKGDRWDPYTIDGKIKTLASLKNGNYQANEPGVTTLMILKDGSVCFWIQSNQAQSSPGLVVASGSGSADWKDCKPFLKKGKPDGLRKSVIFGMERELYEESFGERSITRKEFAKNTKTLVTGYFRWLEKGGKSEFVGFSCVNVEHSSERISPESSEVIKASGARTEKRKKAETVEDLKKLIGEYVKKIEKEEFKKDFPDEDLSGCSAVYRSECNLSTVAAFLSLERLIEEYSKDHPGVSNESAYDWMKKMAEEYSPHGNWNTKHL
ncbi:MAG: hypothetical protein K6C09_06725 [Oscillospiraceae bacterium]|nr:hypothetical protein [Oscillospiraceae bacterium]